MAEVKDRLEQLEAQLAKRYGILRNVREILVEMDRAGALTNDALVNEWRQAFRSLQRE